VGIPTDLCLDPRDIEERGVLQTSGSHSIVSRVGILLSIYFLEGWRSDKRQALMLILQDYLALCPDRGMHYQPGDGRSMPALSGMELPKPYRGLAAIGQDEELYYNVCHYDPEEDDEVSLWRMMGFGFARSNVTRRLSGLKVHFPTGFVLDDPEHFIGLVRRWCGRLGAIHGSAGLGILTEPGSETSWGPCFYPFLTQYPALEYDDMGSYWSQTRHGGYENPRSSNWLTVLGDDNIGALGGIEKIRSSLRPDMDLVSYNGGVVIRAGHLPALGNEETGGIPEAYRTVARLIKPIRFEGYRWGVIKPPEPLEGLDVTLAWIRRFD
jgi:hypothetical protein